MILSLLKIKTVRNISSYTLLNLVYSSIPFLLLPFLTTYLTKTEYGIIDVFTNISFIITPLIGLNVSASIIRYYFEKNKFDFSVFIYNIILFLILFGIGLSIITFALSYLFSDFLEQENIPYIIIPLAVLYALFSQVIEVTLSIWRAQEKPLKFGLFRIIKTITDFGISIYFIVFLKYGWEGRVYVSVFVAFTFSILAIIMLKSAINIKKKYNKRYLKIAINYSAPLILHSIGGYIISFSDRFIILYYLGIEEVGRYAVAYQIGMVMSFINSSFNQAWTPYLFSILKENNVKKKIKIQKYNKYYFILMLVLALIIYFVVPIIYDFFIGKEFEADPQIVLWVLLGYAFNGMYKIIVNYMFYYKNTKKLSLITIISSLINVIFSIILIPFLGLLGASISTAIGFLVMFIVVYYEYNKKYKIAES